MIDCPSKSSRIARYAGAYGAAALTGLLACGSPDVSSPPVPEPGAAFRALTLQARAITMSTAPGYDTLQLVVTPRSALGTPLVGAPAVTFFTTDSSVRVSPTGLLTARAVRSNIKVIAELVYQGVRHADTAVITVTDPVVTPPHRPARLVLRPQVGEDATLPVPTPLSFFYGAMGVKMLEAEVLDSSGAVISEALLAVATSASGQAKPVQPVTTSGPVEIDFDRLESRPGVVTVSAGATVYGVTVRDTLALTLTNPRLVYITVALQSTPGSTPKVYTAFPGGAVPLGVGGSIWWLNTTGDALDVVFDDPPAAVADPVASGLFGTSDGGGNIAPYVGCSGGFFACDNVRARQFPHAGTFPWHSPTTGLSGTIVVQ